MSDNSVRVPLVNSPNGRGYVEISGYGRVTVSFTSYQADDFTVELSELVTAVKTNSTQRFEGFRTAPTKWQFLFFLGMEMFRKEIRAVYETVDFTLAHELEGRKVAKVKKGELLNAFQKLGVLQT